MREGPSHTSPLDPYREATAQFSIRVIGIGGSDGVYLCLHVRCRRGKLKISRRDRFALAAACTPDRRGERLAMDTTKVTARRSGMRALSLDDVVGEARSSIPWMMIESSRYPPSTR
jgi:hypothetical protein